MIDLRVVESGLVPVYEDTESRRVVNARELHAFLGVGKDFSNWIKDRIDKYGFTEGEDFAVCSPNLVSKTGSGGHNAKDYLLTLDTAKEIAMAENSERGRQVRGGPGGMTHTPGPWRVDSSMVRTGWVLVTTSDGNIIANVNTETGPDIPPAVSTKMPAMNNATLIAAAPDMLEALETIMNIGDKACRDIARAAIKKARG